MVLFCARNARRQKNLDTVPTERVSEICGWGDVGHEVVDAGQIGHLRKEAPIELGGVRQDGDLRGARDHLAHHHRFREIAGRESALGRDCPDRDQGEVAVQIEVVPRIRELKSDRSDRGLPTQSDGAAAVVLVRAFSVVRKEVSLLRFQFA